MLASGNVEDGNGAQSSGSTHFDLLSRAAPKQGLSERGFHGDAPASDVGIFATDDFVLLFAIEVHDTDAGPHTDGLQTLGLQQSGGSGIHESRCS
jgi:hypothetical protein